MPTHVDDGRGIASASQIGNQCADEAQSVSVSAPQLLEELSAMLL